MPAPLEAQVDPNAAMTRPSSKVAKATEAAKPGKRTKAAKSVESAPTTEASTPGTATTAAAPQLRFRMRVNCGDVIAVGPGKIALLEAIERTGSITAAAVSLEMSYRRAWLLMDELNRSLRTPALDSSKGGVARGGSSLTASGRELVAVYRRIEVQAAEACRDDIQRLLAMLDGPADQG